MRLFSFQYRSKPLSKADCDASLVSFIESFEVDPYVSFMAKAVSALAAAFRLVQVST